MDQTPTLRRFDEIERLEYDSYMVEWEASGEKIIPMASSRNGGTFDQMQTRWREAETDAATRAGFVPSTLFFLTRGHRILGALSLRHVLNERLSLNGGHIGYGVRPSERRRGYASAMVAQVLQRLVGSGTDRVLLTCDEDNLASKATIESSGGCLEDQLLHNGVWTRRYWIAVPGST